MGKMKALMDYRSITEPLTALVRAQTQVARDVFDRMPPDIAAALAVVDGSGRIALPSVQRLIT